MKLPFLYGLEYASHDFRDPDSLGKNIFTNALPLSLAQYLATVRGLPIPTVRATVKNGRIRTEQVDKPWKDIIGVSPEDAQFDFEAVYSGYGEYTHTDANKSDVVVTDRLTGEQVRPLEIKLVVVPTSATAKNPRDKQACEIVVRPPTVQQLAFSIARSYGTERRDDIRERIVKALGKPGDYSWEDETKMISSAPKILAAAESITEGGILEQTPLVLNAIWRTEGQKPILEENAFDVFVWTDMGFLQLFIDQAKRDIDRASRSQKSAEKKSPSRPFRSIMWLVKSLWDYSIQESLDFGAIHSKVTFGAQTDKAGAFSGGSVLEHLQSGYFDQPRVKRSELDNVLSPESAQYLLPERRLDAAIAIQHLAQDLSRERDISGEGPSDTDED